MEGRAVPRFYTNPVRPSENKAMSPGKERKGRDTTPPANAGKQGESGAEGKEKTEGGSGQ